MLIILTMTLLSSFSFSLFSRILISISGWSIVHVCANLDSCNWKNLIVTIRGEKKPSTQKPYKLHNLETGPSTKADVTREKALEYYKQMQMIRRLETAAGNLYKEKIVRGFCHLYSGQEACAVGMYNRYNDSWNYFWVQKKNNFNGTYLEKCGNSKPLQVIETIRWNCSKHLQARKLFIECNRMQNDHWIVEWQVWKRLCVPRTI